MAAVAILRCAFERVAHLVGKQYGSKREEVERALVETMEIPDGAHAISVSLDRVSIPMEEPRKKDNGSPKGVRKESKRSPQGAERSPKGVRRGRQRCAPFNAYFAWRMRRP